MPKAIQVHAYGGPEVMRYEDVALPAPGPGQIHVRQTAIGVNFIDIYFRAPTRHPSCPSSPARRAPA
jgi:NADPH2:quinone reductase